MDEDTKIYLITFKNETTGEVLVSHGVGNNTLKNVCLPQESVRNFNAKHDNIGIFI